MAKKKKLNEESSQEENLNTPNEADETFGLPDIEYQPLSRSEAPAPEPEPEPEPAPEPVAAYQPEPTPEPAVEESVQTSTYQRPMEEKPEYRYTPVEESASSPVPKVLGILLVVLLAVAAAWFFMVYQPQQREREAKMAKEAEEAKLKRDQEAERDRLEKLRAEAEQRRADSLANIPKTGTIEKLEARTGRYYVVVASAIDDDLIMDYANQLSQKGVSSKIIPPFGKSKFYRIAVADGGTFAEAQGIADSRKPDFTDALWVLKY